MKIAIAGIALECHVFSPIPTRYEDLRICRGEELIDHGPPLVRGMVEALRESDGLQVSPLIFATALPGGSLARDAYERVKSETLGRLKEEGPFDGILLAMHGSMAVGEERVHGDSDYVVGVREAVGDSVPLSVALDLHAGLSPDIVAAGDVFAAYRTAPHTDVAETGHRAVRQLMGLLQDRKRVSKAFVKIPLVLFGEQAVTDHEPLRDVMASLRLEDAGREGLRSTVVLGHVWNDMKWMGASVVVTDVGKQECRKRAEEIAQGIWDKRSEFRFEMECAEIADAIRECGLRTTEGPVYLTDNGDNVTGGAPGDLTIVLQEFLKSGVVDAMVPGIASPTIVRECVKRGVGKRVRLTLGCDHTLLKDRTMDVIAEIVSIGDTMVDAAFFSGRMGPWAKVRIDGVTATFHDHRVGIVTRKHLSALGIDPIKHKFYVVKQGYLFPDLQLIARRYLLMLSPGSTEFDLSRNAYRHIQRPIWPIDSDMAWSAVGKSILVETRA